MMRWALGGSDSQEPSHDPGLQAERTAMAWERTALGVAAVSALLLHDTGGSLLAKLPGTLGLSVALVLLVATELRYAHTVRQVGIGQSPASPALVLALAISVTLLAVLAVAVILV